ncbi:MAG: hypothetical protein JO129_04155, partial [Candidatus Dependentiae bacterium]|nr:hypothetical protein [Candidatus Dependentiae bacterium]
MKIVILICMIFISYFEGMQGSETSETSSFNSQGALGAAGNLAQFNNNPTGGSNKTAPLKSAANSVLSEDVMKNQQFAQTKRQINEGKSPQNQVPINKLGSGSRVIATPINLSTALKFKADETTPTDPKKLAQMGIAGVTLASTAQTLTLPETQSARANAEKILKKNELDLSQLASPINTETLKQNTSNDITPQDQVSNLAVSTVTPVSKIASVSKVTPASGEPVSGFESIKDLIKNKPGDYNNLLTAISFDEQKLSEENRGWFSSSPKITPQEIKQTDTIDKFKTKYNYNQENFDKAFIAFNKDIISLQAKIEKLKANTTLRNNLEALLKKAEDARNTMVKERVDFLTKKINETPIAKVFPIYDGYLTALKAARINPIYEQYKQIYTDVVENLNKITEAVAQLKKDPSLEGGSKNPEIDSIKIAIEKAPVELILDPLKDQVIAQLQFDLAKAEGSEAAYQKIQDEANSKVDELWSAYLIALKNDPNNPNLEIDPIHIALTDFKNELDSEVQKNSNLE